MGICDVLSGPNLLALRMSRVVLGGLIQTEGDLIMMTIVSNIYVRLNTFY